MQVHRGPSDQPSAPPSGRKAQSGRNDTLILDAAREVFLRDPRAPISAVAERAGVGISALYRRYPSKEVLLQKLCADGLQRYIEVAERSLAPALAPWDAFAGFLTGIVESDVHSRTAHLAGTLPAERGARRPAPARRRPHREAHEADPTRAPYAGTWTSTTFRCSSSR